MPIERRLDPATQVLQTTMSGRVTIDELREHLTVVHDMNWQRVPELIDVREATTVLSARDLPHLAAFGRRLFGQGYMAPRAVIVSGVMYFGLARLFASIAAPWVRIAVFDTLPPAEGWLDLVSKLTQI